MTHISQKILVLINKRRYLFSKHVSVFLLSGTHRLFFINANKLHMTVKMQNILSLGNNNYWTFG